MRIPSGVTGRLECEVDDNADTWSTRIREIGDSGWANSSLERAETSPSAQQWRLCNAASSAT
jgi:hypothetical protein